MTDSVRLAISGASGRMGRSLLDLGRSQRRFQLCRAVIARGSDLVGKPTQDVATPTGLRFSAGWDDAGDIDVVVDFSSPEGLRDALAFCVRENVALVVGTTGFGDDLEQALAEASARIPLLRAANFSLGVAVLTRLLREAAASLSHWDLEILEMHHGRKEDAPSGTALALAQAAADARSVDLADAAVYAREGRTGPREAGTIGFSVVRAGDIVGEHTAFLVGKGERLELSHRATDRAIFARGALEAAAWLAGQPPGTYNLDDMLAARASR